MCRFVTYLGKDAIFIKELLESPQNSLIQQSYAAKKSSSIVNGDGFGLAWYDEESGTEPGIFRSTHPAWNDKNLKNISSKIKSKCFIAHIRKATIGDVTLNNCHPFSYKQYSFAHNGSINHFEKIRRRLTNELSDHFFSRIKSETDSEHLFFLIMYFLHINSDYNLEKAVIKSFDYVVNMQIDDDDQHNSKLNIVITDGNQVIATRFASKNHEALSLYYVLHDDRNTSENNNFKKKPSITIASEPLNDYKDHWNILPVNHYLSFRYDDLDTKIKSF